MLNVTEFSEEHRQRLLVRARAGRPLVVDDVLAVMPGVELTLVVLAEVRKFLTENSIPFDEQAIPHSELANMEVKGRRKLRRRADPARIAAAAMAQASSSSDPIRMYLKEIGKVPLLKAEEEVDLAKRIEAGAEAAAKSADLLTGDGNSWKTLPFDEQRKFRRKIADGERACQELTSANLRLVVSISKRYMNRGVPILDLVQEGNLGLMRAVQKYDYSKGFKFSTYATWWIRQAISRAIADQSRTIRVPVHMVESINRVIRAQRHLSQKLEREPTLAEIANEVSLTEDKVGEILQIASQDPLSLDTPVGDESDTSMADFIPDGAEAPIDQAARKFMSEAVKDVLDDLTDRESEVVRLRFGLTDGRPRTLEEVGKQFGVTRERIRQIESKTLAKLRHPLRSDQLRDFLE